MATQIEEVEERFITRQHLYRDTDKERQRLEKLASTLAITLEDYKYALRKFKGNLTKTAEFLAIERAVLKRKVDSTPSLRHLAHQLKEEDKDYIEEVLVSKARAGDMSAVSLYLKTQAKDRGYTERVESTADPLTLASSAAALIEAMKRGAKPQLEDANTIDVEDYSWEEAK